MKGVFNYSVATLFSLALHAIVVAALLITWESDHKQVIVQPQYIEAKLVELAPKKKEQPKAKPKPKVDDAQKKREQAKRQEEQRRKAEQKRKADLARKEKLRQERLKKEKQEQERREQEEVERKAAEERKRIETEFSEALSREAEQLSAETNEQVANSYRQLIQRRLSENWSRPPSARLGMETVIRIRLVPTGRVTGVEILRSSGDVAFDRSVEQAVFKADPFEELKQLYQESPRLFEQRFRQVDVAFSPEDLRL